MKKLLYIWFLLYSFGIVAISICPLAKDIKFDRTINKYYADGGLFGRKWVETSRNDGFDIYKLYKCLTMDLIWRCCFGIKTDMQNNPNDPYLKRSQQVFARENSTYIATLLAIFIPELQPVWLTIHCWINNIKAKLRCLLPMGEKFIEDDPSEWLKDNVDYFIEKAKALHENNNDHNENIIKSTDLIHLMLEATKKNLADINQVKIVLKNI